MTVQNYKELVAHYGHEITIAKYADENATIECDDCAEILFDFDTATTEQSGTLWVADDGSYGSGEVVEFDTAKWQDNDFELVDTADDYRRLAIAKMIDHERNGA